MKSISNPTVKSALNNANGNGNGNGNGRQPCGAVLVCGGGVAGIQASLDLSAAGFRVYLVEESPTIGGSMARLDKTFPTGDCATCIISPKLVECMRDYNIDVLTMADVTRLEGEAGNFKVEIRKPRGAWIPANAPDAAIAGPFARSATRPIARRCSFPANRSTSLTPPGSTTSSSAMKANRARSCRCCKR